MSESFPDEGMTEFADTEVEVDPATAGSTPAESAAGAHDDGADDDGADQDGAESQGGEATVPGPDPLEAAQRQLAELTGDLQRLQAEYVNYKRRVDRDRELTKENAKFAVLAALLPVLDDVDRARQHEELTGGFKAIAEALERVVAGQGLDKFGEPGDEFDPRLHEALMHGHSAEVTTSTCQNIVQAGYKIGDRVVRPAMVTVVDPE